MKPQCDSIFKLLFGSALALFSVFCLSSCNPEESEYKDTPLGNFQALWQLIDDRYCFFEYKEIDWNRVYNSYRPRIKTRMTEEELFEILAEMLRELRDGHVNLTSPFDVARYWDWNEKYPVNFDINLVNRHYLLPDYQIASGIKYKVMPNNIGYAYYSSFSLGVGEANLDYILLKFASCKGMIIDVRNNGGGTLTYANTIAARFTNRRLLTGYIQHKTGKGYNDFSEPYPIYLDPSTRIRYQKPVVILTNRGCYSATNNFVSIMKELPTVTVVGDTTGGGSGLPFSGELPNGWTVRFSSSPIYNNRMEQIEFGVAPDIRQDLLPSDTEKGIDSMIERAYAIIEEQNQKEVLKTELNKSGLSDR